MLEDFYDIAQQLGQKLQSRDLFLATAESCTGGLVAATLTQVAGSSAWFERGFVTYSNLAKQSLLNVPESILAQFGAVSVETAQAMAEGALRQSNANLSLAITGIAGPSGGSEAKPVGTVCFGFAYDFQKTEIECINFSGNRAIVRKKCVRHVIEYLIRML